MENNKGFSLVEIVVVIGVMGIVVGGISSSFIYFTKMMNKIEARQDIVSLGSQLQTIISSKATCEQSLGLDSSSIPFRIAEAQRSDAERAFHLGMTVLGELVTASTDLTIYPLRVNYLTLSDAESAGIDSSGWNVYKVNLNGSFSSTRATMGTSYVRNKVLGSFLIKVDGSNRMRSCFSLNPNDPGSIDELMSMLCARSEGSYDTSTGRCEGLANSSVGQCPSGKVLRGISSSGAPNCVDAPSDGGAGCVDGETTNTHPSSHIMCIHTCQNGRWSGPSCHITR